MSRETRLAMQVLAVVVFFVLVIALLTMAFAAEAHAAVRCPGGGQPDAHGRCAYAPARPDDVCGWPFRSQPDNRRLTYCWRAAGMP